MRRGQMNTAAQVLDSLARQVGCDEPEPPPNPYPKSASASNHQPEMTGRTPTQLPPIDVTETENVEND